MNNISEKSWRWWAGRDGKMHLLRFCPNRGDTIAEAVQNDHSETSMDINDLDEHRIRLVEAQNAPLLLGDWIDMEDVLECTDERIGESNLVNCDYSEVGPFLDSAPEELADLTVRIKAVIKDCDDADKIVVTSPTFGATRNHEIVVMPSKEGTAA